jgi:hypothetical protein
MLLAAHGVDGDNAAFEVQNAQQLGDGRDFVSLVVDLDLAEQQ